MLFLLIVPKHNKLMMVEKIIQSALNIKRFILMGSSRFGRLCLSLIQ